MTMTDDDIEDIQSRFDWIKVRQIVQIILLVICTLILCYFLMKFIQVENALSDFGNNFNPDPTPTFDPGE